MTLDEALTFADLKVREGYISDRCTFFPDLGLSKYCIMHDVLWRYHPFHMTYHEADILFIKGICRKAKEAKWGWRYYPLVPIIYTGVRIGAFKKYIERKFK